MLKRISNTPIFLRLLLTFAWAMIIPTTVILLLGNSYFQALFTEGRAVQTSNQTIKITTNELAHLQSMHALLVALLPSITINNTMTASTLKNEQNIIFQVLSIEGSFDVDTVKYQEQYQLATADSMADIRHILLSNDPHTTIITRQQELLDQILKHQWPQYKAAQDDVLIGLDTKIPLAEAARLLQKADALYSPLLANWQQVVNIAETVNTEVVKVGPAQTNPLLFGTISAFLGSMLIVFALGYLVNLTITRPLHQLVTLTRRIIRGETHARAALSGNNEISRVASSMNTMLDHIVQLMQDTQSQRDVLQARVEKLAREVKGVGEGNLGVRAEVTDDALGMFANSFNYMLHALSSLIVGIKKVAHEVERSAATILTQMSRLVKTGNVQIQQIAETTTRVEQTASASHAVAHRAQRLYGVASQAHQSAQNGHQAVWQAISEIEHIHTNVQATANKIQALGERSQEINNIVSAISTIAHQTNRLALDSAIQAAIAGEHGKDFGAVAANIRRLAEQTKDQTYMIARIVRNIREDIAMTISSMQNTEKETASETRATQDVGEALEASFIAVERQTSEIASITQMAMQQRQLANTVVQTMHSISDATRQNSPGVDNATQHVQRLAQLVAQLRASVDVFKLQENHASHPDAH